MGADVRGWASGFAENWPSSQYLLSSLRIPLISLPGDVVRADFNGDAIGAFNVKDARLSRVLWFACYFAGRNKKVVMGVRPFVHLPVPASASESRPNSHGG